MRILYKLILAFVLISFLIWIVSFFAVDFGQKALEKSIGESFVFIATELLDKIDRHVTARIEVFHELAASDEVQETLDASNAEYGKLDNREEYIDKQDKKWILAPADEITPFMRDILDNDLSRMLQRKTEFYQSTLSDKTFGEVFITNKYGVNIAQSGRTSDFRQNDEEWWRQTREKGLYVSDIEYDKSSDIFSVIVGLRIDDRKGNFKGILKMVLNIREIISILKDAEKKSEFKGEVYQLATRKGKLIYSTRSYELFESLSEKVFGYVNSLGEKGYFVLKESPLKGRQDELIAYATSMGNYWFEGLGWIMLVRHDTEEIYAPVRLFKSDISFISALVAFFSILLGIVVSESISIPVTKLKNAVSKVGEGNFDVKADIYSKDEIGELSKAFNKMVSDLKRTTTSIYILNSEIEERKNVEKRLERLLEEMKKANFKLKNTQRQLVQSEKLASIGQLSAGVAHEINNPLAFVYNNICALEDYTSDLINLLEECDKCLEDKKTSRKKAQKEISKKKEEVDAKYITEDIGPLIKESKEGLERIRKIVFDLNSFARKDAGERKPGNINDIIENMLNIISGKLKYKTEIKKEYGEIPMLKCNIQQIGQVFMNILVNAAQSIKDKGTITIRTFFKDGDIYAVVSDNGDGMTTDVLNNIFEPFFTTKQEGKGTGLGLSISYDIVKKHNGEISAESEPGKGTTFTVILPADA